MWYCNIAFTWCSVVVSILLIQVSWKSVETGLSHLKDKTSLLKGKVSTPGSSMLVIDVSNSVRRSVIALLEPSMDSRTWMFSVLQPNKKLLPIHPQIFWITFLFTGNKVTDALPQLMEAFLSKKSEVSVQVIIFWVILSVFFNHWQVICLQSYKINNCVCIY